MNFLDKRLQGKLVTSISKENDVCIVAFDDGTAMTVNTAVSPWFVAEAEPPRVTDFVRRDHGYRIILAGQSYIDISADENRIVSPEIFHLR
ncbi:MAG: hypothetical protein E5W98_13410 [Mesorhizobium sp.]|nr:MAG: hypothetical protein E5W98_13410 [Mesorhizobium sp.]